MFDTSKIRTFKLEDLIGRTLKIKRFEGEGAELVIAFEASTGESFLLKYRALPVAEPAST